MYILNYDYCLGSNMTSTNLYSTLPTLRKVSQEKTAKNKKNHHQNRWIRAADFGGIEFSVFPTNCVKRTKEVKIEEIDLWRFILGINQIIKLYKILCSSQYFMLHSPYVGIE